MPTATQVLVEEHEQIRAVLEPAMAALPSIEPGSPLPTDALEALRAWAAVSTSGLADHAAKEEEILFPAIERILGSGAGPTQVMRSEHRHIHEIGERFRQALAEARDRDHPALEAEVRSFNQALDQVSRGQGPLSAVAEALRDLADVLQGHFEKEEQVLFPLVESVLTQDAQLGLGAQLADYTSGEGPPTNLGAEDGR